MASLDRPKLRPLSTQRFVHRGQPYAAFEDPLGIFAEPILIPLDGLHRVVRYFDGETSLDEIRARVQRETGQPVSAAQLETLIGLLDRAMVLDGPTFAAFQDAYRSTLIRPAALAGRSYAGSEGSLRAQLRQFFNEPCASGPPRAPVEPPSRRLRGVLSPHIDFSRGGPVYTWSYRELAERCDAEVFVIFGVAHQYCGRRFALTRKDFATPLGVVPNARDHVDRIAALAGNCFFEDELAHRTEHSIEFQAVFLQYVLGDRRKFSIVPILVGSFHDLMESGNEPMEDDEVGGFIQAIRQAEAESGKRIAYIGGIDLCHVGPEFGDPDPVDSALRERIRGFDHALLDRAVAGDAAGWFATAAEVRNRWRVCGLAATYTMLHAMGPAPGRLLKYDQAVDPRRTCCVSFASVAYDWPTESPAIEVSPRA